MKSEKTFGDTIRELREEKNLPLREVAVALEIDTSMLSKLEKNNRRPSKKIIEKISQFFQVSNKELMIAHLSDTIASQVMYEEGFAHEVLKVAERKVKYLSTNKLLNQ